MRNLVLLLLIMIIMILTSCGPSYTERQQRKLNALNTQVANDELKSIVIERDNVLTKPVSVANGCVIVHENDTIYVPTNRIGSVYQDYIVVYLDSKSK